MPNPGTNKIWVPLYPQAQTKIDYYNAIITELDGYKNNVNTDINAMNLSKYKTLVESTDMKGPYYDTYVTHKDNWFSDLATMKSTFASAMQDINNGISDATKLRDEWVQKKSQGHWKYI
ncbi:MAG: hypothetical protein IJJ59_14840 [Pseudobutyrivibrio sp.]|uniref:hypothetical protein n=1 Tax=Pseudobutyrivibrio sp. TaxID=2014367 RepID=UPI0025DBF93C|nr:hypothetical protein [Pseudobutyrivibrio sp.]MBQ6464602.1 hypothetical protein [Pseudobutyrivibrio sp.]